uniref:Uncharacterized protein n=1 Tax=Sphaerodactylus townsendi TaxID=933632 RepID=A0ACB8G7U2_9SAUR
METLENASPITHPMAVATTPRPTGVVTAVAATHQSIMAVTGMAVVASHHNIMGAMVTAGVTDGGTDPGVAASVMTLAATVLECATLSLEGTAAAASTVPAKC